MTAARCASLALLAAVLLLGGCWRDYGSARNDPGPRVLHTVAAGGESLVAIARLYGVRADVIIEANDLRTGRDLPLKPGRQLIIPGGRLPPPPPVVAPPQPDPAPQTPVAPTSRWYQPRDTWAVEPILFSRIDPMGGTPIRITVHHSNMPGDTDSDAAEVLRKIDREHHKNIGAKGKPGACIGYHFLIARDGTVYEGRPIQFQGAHAGGDNNKLNIGVCLLGNFEDHPLPAAQRTQLIAVLDRLRDQYGISRSQVFGHKDFNPPGSYHTDCPGRFLEPVVVAYRSGRLGRVHPALVPMATSRPAP